MKRLFIFSLLLLSSAAYAATKNKISMVTYFPVPYVAYSQVNTTEQMDIGLTSTCDMKLGCSETSAALNATRVNLKGGKLNLDGGLGIKGYSLNLGSGNGEGRISFQNVRIQMGNMESVNAQDMKVSALELFGKTFPSCKEKDSSGQMKWASLKLKGASSNELYLMCGDFGKSTACQPTDPRGATYTEPCPAGQTGTGAQYTWDVTTCSYKRTKASSCSSGLKRYLTNYKCTGVNKRYSEIDGFIDESNVRDCSTVKSENMYWSLWDASPWLTGFEQIPSGCSPGKECASCVPGKKYISGHMFPGKGCRMTNMNAGERDRALIVVKYVSCGEHTSPYTPEPAATCARWSDTGGGGGEELLQPNIPSL